MSQESFQINQNEAVYTAQENQENAQELVLSSIAHLVEAMEEGDSIHGSINGRLGTVPTTYFEASFDTDKENISDVIAQIISEKIPEGVDILSLNRDIRISDKTEGEKPAETRISKGGGSQALIQEKK